MDRVGFDAIVATNFGSLIIVAGLCFFVNFIRNGKSHHNLEGERKCELILLHNV